MLGRRLLRLTKLPRPMRQLHGRLRRQRMVRHRPLLPHGQDVLRRQMHRCPQRHGQLRWMWRRMHECVPACVPTGMRQSFNTLGLSPGGCITGNPCSQDVSVQSAAYIASFEVTNAALTCTGTTACISHVGIGTYTTAANCQGVWDVYCDAKKLGTIITVGKACANSAMANGCSLTFAPTTCSSIKLVAVQGSGTSCCSAPILPVDTRVTAVSAW
jgi:hypothetical protein